MQFTYWDESFQDNTGHSCAFVSGEWSGTWTTSDCLDSRAYVCKFVLQAEPPVLSLGTAAASPPPGNFHGTPTNASYAFSVFT